MRDSENIGKLVLRVVLGALILLHGVSKLIHGPDHVEQMVMQAGLPAFVAWGVYVGEVAAPVLLIVGVWTRLAALVVVVNMLFAVGLAHMSQLLALGGSGGWALELQGMYLAAAVTIMLLGAGRLSVGGVRGRWN